MKKKLRSLFNKKDWEFPAKGTRWDTASRRRKLLEYADEIGLYNINKKEFAEMVGCSSRQIYLDIDALVKGGLDRDVLMHAKFNIDKAIKKVMREMQSLLISEKKPQVKVAAAQALLSAAEKQTDFLERYGEKEKSAEVIDTTVEVKWMDPVVPKKRKKVKKSVKAKKRKKG